MVRFRITCLLISIFVALSLGGAFAQYEFGSKVTSGDSDEKRMLDVFDGTLTLSLGYWDIGAESGLYDEGDPIYLHIGTTQVPARINSNDIRLTPFGMYRPGTKVTAADNDIGQLLVPLDANALTGTAGAIYYNDLYGITTGYDEKDSVYIKATGFGSGIFPFPSIIVTNDVRITPIPIVAANETLPGGAKVKDFDPDNNNWGQAMLGLPNPWGAGAPLPRSIAWIKFYNANGNFNALGVPVYDYPDDVYIDVPLILPVSIGFVSSNDVRLTIVSK